MDNPFKVLYEKLTEIQNSIKLLADTKKSSEAEVIIEQSEETSYDIPQLANYLNCSKSTVHRYKKNRIIPCKQAGAGKKVIFIKSEVDKALSSRRK